MSPPSEIMPAIQPGLRNHLTEIRNARHATAEQLFDAVAQVALAQAGHAGVDRDDQRSEACRPRALQHLDRRLASAAQIHLIPRRDRSSRP